MNRLLLLLVAGLLAGPLSLWADSPLLRAQTRLHELGFYTGPLDGKETALFRQALRRYQLHQGLSPSETLDTATQEALAKEEPPAVEESDHDFLRQNPAPAPSPTPAPVIPPAPAPPPRTPPPSAPAPGRPPSSASSEGYRTFFASTPFERAPGSVQRDTLRRIQRLLRQRGLFRGAESGLPDVATRDALLRFQALERLGRTGRGDFDTLERLNLLPVPGVPFVPLDGEPPRPPQGGPIYRGRLPEEAPTVPGAVRGIPLD